MSKTVVLDAGHYKGYNRYPAAKGYSEGNQMWALANKLKAELERKGVNVVMTKGSLEANPGLTTRGATAGRNAASLFISLHSNAVSNAVNDNVIGVECYYSIFDNKGKDFADKLCSAVASVMSTTNRGAKTRKGSGNWDYYSVIKGAVDSGCKQAFLIEHGFHTSHHDANFLIVDENLQKIAEAECEVICNYLGISASNSTETPTETKPATRQYAHSVGEHIVFSTCYKSSTDGTDKHINASDMSRNHGVITKIVNAPNPYLLDNGLCWVNDGDIRGFYSETGTNSAAGISVQILDNNLNIRSGAGTKYKVVGQIKDHGIYTIVEVRGTLGKSGSWGKLKSGAGWISLNKCFAVKV